ncbi:MAG: HAD family hydrolase [Thermodesulfobacteriota bacterium]
MNPIHAALFDFGGVLAEEGFSQGLHRIARNNRHDPEAFFAAAARIVYECGYVTGATDEGGFWSALRALYPLRENDGELSGLILDLFLPRPAMLDLVSEMRAAGIRAAILSDQSDWLDRLEARHHFFHLFDQVFNSFHLGKSKKDPTLFADIRKRFGCVPAATLFVDDNPGHIARARSQGFLTHLFTDIPSCQAACRALLPT